jgi:pilus assembly protein CpaD
MNPVITTQHQADGGTAMKRNKQMMLCAGSEKSAVRLGVAMRLGAALAATLMVAGCSAWRPSDALDTGSIPFDYRERHPIVLRDAPRTLDVFASGNSARLDRRQQADVEAFAKSYAASGHGPLVAYVPAGQHGSHGMHAVNAALAAGGVGGRPVRVVSYTPDIPGTAAPIRLSFSRLQAQVDSKCDVRIEDAAQVKGGASFENRNHANFGCAYQTNLAAQVAEPIDLVRPRQEDPIDAEKRKQGIDKLRTGTDPSTFYISSSARVNSVVP